jgi:hypothetical protein
VTAPFFAVSNAIEPDLGADCYLAVNYTLNPEAAFDFCSAPGSEAKSNL